MQEITQTRTLLEDKRLIAQLNRLKHDSSLIEETGAQKMVMPFPSSAG